MQQALLAIQSPYVIIGLCALVFMLLIIVLLLNSKINRLQKKTRRLFVKTEGENLEITVSRILDSMDTWEGKLAEQQFLLNRMSQKMASQVGNVGVHRYNAFGDSMGSDLSFSLALMDEHLNGIVITSIYGRDESRTYCKPVEKGTSTYNLSEEEMLVIKKASS
ncbi:DUF4446 family protein [Brevibacillus daliensis]|uniref:DUF4446 family protein n=1 Tax=Brevibacillus daliensis TaxID=2892995 RepID=UPI001E4FF3E3|nr:DUF4446 family protein [Brevibacillus daliensis]